MVIPASSAPHRRFHRIRGEMVILHINRWRSPDLGCPVNKGRASKQSKKQPSWFIQYWMSKICGFRTRRLIQGCIILFGRALIWYLPYDQLLMGKADAHKLVIWWTDRNQQGCRYYSFGRAGLRGFKAIWLRNNLNLISVAILSHGSSRPWRRALHQAVLSG